MSRRALTTSVVGALDQGVFSLGNIVLVAALAATLSDGRDFGSFALVMAVYETVQLLLRGYFAQPLSLVLSDGDHRSTMQGACALGLLGGAGSALIAAAILAIGSLPAPPAVLVACAAFPLVSAHEVYRTSAFAVDRPQTALLLDSLWTGWQLATLLIAWLIGSLGPTIVAASWATGCLLAVAVGWVVLRCPPALSAVRPYVAVSRPYAWGFTRDNVLSAGQTHGFTWLAAALGGLVVLGQLRLLRALFGAATVSIAGLRISMTPLARRAWNRGRQSGFAKLLLVSGIVGVSAVAVNLVIVLSPLGDRLLEIVGDTVGDLDPLLVPYSLVQLSFACTVVVVIAVVATGHTRALALPRLAAALLTLAGGAIGFAIAGLGTALSLSAIGTLCSIPLWVITFRRVAAQPGISQSRPDSGDRTTAARARRDDPHPPAFDLASEHRRS